MKKIWINLKIPDEFINYKYFFPHIMFYCVTQIMFINTPYKLHPQKNYIGHTTLFIVLNYNLYINIYFYKKYIIS